MRAGVVVATCDAHARTWLPDCLRSLAPLPVHLAWNDGEHRNAFDAAAVFVGYELGLEEWWVMPDTVVVHEPGRLLLLLHQEGIAYSVGNPPYLSCIGKVRRETIDRIGLPPQPRTKHEAVDFECWWFRDYALAEGDGLRIVDPGFVDGPEREERHGRENMVIRSSLLTKWKSHWTREMCNEDAA